MIRQPVNSSNIRSIGYDARSETLEIEFHGGGVYQYRGVPATIHAALMTARSHGGFFHQHIKGRFPDERII
jgi:hypothetical protein